MNNFAELEHDFTMISEMIRSHYNSNPYGLDKEQIDKTLDNIHGQLCKAASTMAQELINSIDNGTYDRRAEETKRRQLVTLFEMAYSCFAYGMEPVERGLTERYGNGVIDAIGADFVVESERSEHKYFDYGSFYELISDIYEIV